MAYNKQNWKDEIPDLTKPIRDASGKQKTDPQTGRPLYELVQEGTRISSERLNHMEEGINAAHNSAEQKADSALAAAKTYTDTGLLSKADKSSTYTKTETDERIQSVVGAAPEALDTLKEIGDALNNDPNFAATMTNQLSGKVDKVPGKQLSTEDFSSEEKAKLAGLTTGAGGAGSATDAVIGNRTIVDTEAPTGDSGPPSKLWSWLAYMIKAITGKSSWRTAPATTLEAAKTHADDTTRHITAAERTGWNTKETTAGAQAKADAARDAAIASVADKLNQDVRSTASPTFSGINVNGVFPLVSKWAGYKSWAIHHPSDNTLRLVPSTSLNGIDWDWANNIVLSDTGELQAKTIKANAGMTVGNGSASVQGGILFKPDNNSAWFWLADIAGVLTFGKDGVFGTNPLVTMSNTGLLTVPSLSLTGPKSRSFMGGSLNTKVYENLAYVSSNVASTTGTLKIMLPMSWNNTMMRIKIGGYNYNPSHGAWDLLLGGYNFSTSPQWYRTSAVLNGSAPFNSVRFAHDGTNCCILLGTTATVWEYPKIVIEQFTSTSGVIDGWETGWTISIITDETGLTVSGTPVINAGVMADTVDGYHFNQGLLTTNAPTFAGLTLTADLNMTSNINIARAAPIISMNETDQATNEKLWWTVVDAKMYQIRTLTDAGGSGATAMSIVRGTGVAIASVQFPNIPVQAATFASTVAQGTAPMTVISDTKVEKFHADLLDGVHASGAADPTTIPVRNSNKKIAEVAANRAVAKDAPVGTATTTIATYTPAAAGLYTVKISAGLSTAAGISINVSYTGPRGAKNESIIATYSTAAGEYYYVPVMFMANAGAAINVTASSTTTGAAFVSAVITEEG